jgi:hypothetical protein
MTERREISSQLAGWLPFFFPTSRRRSSFDQDFDGRSQETRQDKASGGKACHVQDPLAGECLALR